MKAWQRLCRYRILLLIMIAALGIMGYLALTQPYQEAYTPNNLIRLHVVANSDRPEDQALKYQVRDAVVQELGPRLTGVKSVKEAEALVCRSSRRLGELANSRLALADAPYRARVEIGRYSFPTRSYYDVVLPAGDYKAVRVVLGRGEGRNWWCVLFPPLCFVDIATTSELGEPVAAAAGEPAPAQTTMTGTATTPAESAGSPPIQARWRILEILQHSQRRLARLWSAS